MLTEMAAPKNSASPCVRAIPRPVHPIRQSAPVTRHCALHSRYVPLARCDDWHASPHALDRPRPALKPHKKSGQVCGALGARTAFLYPLHVLASTSASIRSPTHSEPIRSDYLTRRTPSELRTRFGTRARPIPVPMPSVLTSQATYEMGTRGVFSSSRTRRWRSSEFGDAKSADPGQIAAHQSPVVRTGRLNRRLRV